MSTLVYFVCCPKMAFLESKKKPIHPTYHVDSSQTKLGRHHGVRFGPSRVDWRLQGPKNHLFLTSPMVKIPKKQHFGPCEHNLGGSTSIQCIYGVLLYSQAKTMAFAAHSQCQTKRKIPIVERNRHNFDICVEIPTSLRVYFCLLFVYSSKIVKMGTTSPKQ